MKPDRLSEILWRQRQAADELLYRLEVERLVLVSGEARWAGYAAEDVDRAVADLRSVERERAAEATTLAVDLGLPAVATLREMSDALDEPWRYIFDDHHRALAHAVSEADRQRGANERLLAKGHDGVWQHLSWAEGATKDDGHGSVGRRSD